MQRLRLTMVLCFLAPAFAWSQPAGGPVLLENAYVTIFPTVSTEPDFVLALQRGIELVLCQSGVRPRLDGPEGRSELKLAASLIKSDFETDLQARELIRTCELANASATLPGGANVPLADLAMSSRVPIPASGGGRRASESFFLACGAGFARTALDALKGKVTLRSSSCDEQPPPHKPRRKK